MLFEIQKKMKRSTTCYTPLWNGFRKHEVDITNRLTQVSFLLFSSRDAQRLRNARVLPLVQEVTEGYIDTQMYMTYVALHRSSV